MRTANLGIAELAEVRFIGAVLPHPVRRLERITCVAVNDTESHCQGDILFFFPSSGFGFRSLVHPKANPLHKIKLKKSLLGAKSEYQEWPILILARESRTSKFHPKEG